MMNEKMYLGWVTLPILGLSLANSFFFCTQFLKSDVPRETLGGERTTVNLIAQQPQHRQTRQIASRSQTPEECLRSGKCANS
ncbi:MAG: hypothetical protein QNJ51_02945 [Calothrix sp. MO_167.B12]|nr:hypothetical protein [Calothrix sp. MO_167.B12]